MPDGKAFYACTVRDASILTGLKAGTIRTIVQGKKKKPVHTEYRFAYVFDNKGTKYKKIDLNLDLDLLNKYYRTLLAKGFTKPFAKYQITLAAEEGMRKLIKQFEVPERTEQELLDLEKSI